MLTVKLADGLSSQNNLKAIKQRLLESVLWILKNPVALTD